jgi:hypothetical protein
LLQIKELQENSTLPTTMVYLNQMIQVNHGRDLMLRGQKSIFNRLRGLLQLTGVSSYIISINYGRVSDPPKVHRFLDHIMTESSGRNKVKVKRERHYLNDLKIAIKHY